MNYYLDWFFSFILITVSLTKINFDDRSNSVWNFFVKRNALLSIFYSSSFVASGSSVESIDSTWSSIKSSILANSFSRTLSTYNTLRTLIGLLTFFTALIFDIKWFQTVIVQIVALDCVRIYTSYIHHFIFLTYSPYMEHAVALSVALFTVIFSHLHYSIIQKVCEVISGNYSFNPKLLPINIGLHCNANKMITAWTRALL